MVDPLRRVRVGRIARAELERLLADIGIDVSQRLPLEQAAVGQHLDGAPVRQLRDGEVRDLDKQLVGVERGGEYLAAPREEALALLGALVGGDVLDDVDRHRHVAVGVADRGGLDRGPALLAGLPDAEADDRLGAVLSRERSPAGKRLERVGSPSSSIMS